MAKLIKIERAGTVLFIEADKIDRYLRHGYTVVQPENMPEQIKPPLYNETQESVEPVIIKVQIVGDVTDENGVEQPVLSDEPEAKPAKPKRKPRKKANK